MSYSTDCAIKTSSGKGSNCKSSSVSWSNINFYINAYCYTSNGGAEKSKPNPLNCSHCISYYLYAPDYGITSNELEKCYSLY